MSHRACCNSGGVCDHYDVPSNERPELEVLQERAAEPGWWNGSGKSPDATAELLGMELAAVRIRAWDLTAIPGLLQRVEGSVTAKALVEKDVTPYEEVWGWLQAKALTPKETTQFLQDPAARDEIKPQLAQGATVGQ
jgi:hypothetical protein